MDLLELLTWTSYVHGGAFRDPLLDSRVILPSLASIFRIKEIQTVASLNYRLSSYSDYPGGVPEALLQRQAPASNVLWPTHIHDLRDALAHLSGVLDLDRRPWLLVGHSVGATMAMLLGMKCEIHSCWAMEAETAGFTSAMQNLAAIVGLEGIYDFDTCTKNHPASEAVYRSMWDNAFGDGNWAAGSVTKCLQTAEMKSVTAWRESVRLILLCHSQDDELVEIAQSRTLHDRLRDSHGQAMIEFMLVEGQHQQVESEGRGIARCLDMAMQLLMQTQR